MLYRSESAFPETARSNIKRIDIRKSERLPFRLPRCKIAPEPGGRMLRCCTCSPARRPTRLLEFKAFARYHDAAEME